MSTGVKNNRSFLQAIFGIFLICFAEKNVVSLYLTRDRVLNALIINKLQKVYFCSCTVIFLLFPLLFTVIFQTLFFLRFRTLFYAEKAKVHFAIRPLLEKMGVFRKRCALGMLHYQLPVFFEQVAAKYQVGYFRIMGIIVRRVANNNIEWVIVAFQKRNRIAANDANIIQPEMLDIFPYKMAASVAYIHRRNMLASP